MGIWRVARHAPGRLDSPSPVLCRRAPSNSPPETPATLLFPFGFLELQVIKSSYGVRMLRSCTFESDERIRVRAYFQFNKVNVPVLRRDLGRIK
eukprot:1149759-Pelagomonas_calceolata.AAC.7